MNLINLSQQKLVPNDFPFHNECPAYPMSDSPGPMDVSNAAVAADIYV